MGTRCSILTQDKSVLGILTWETPHLWSGVMVTETVPRDLEGSRAGQSLPARA